MSNTSLKSETDMGRVTTHVRIENASDHWRAHNGEIDLSDVRCVEVDDALIDTGCSSLAMPKRLVDQLGLQFLRARQVRGVGGYGNQESIPAFASLFRAVTAYSMSPRSMMAAPS